MLLRKLRCLNQHPTKRLPFYCWYEAKGTKDARTSAIILRCFSGCSNFLRKLSSVLIKKRELPHREGHIPLPICISLTHFAARTRSRTVSFVLVSSPVQQGAALVPLSARASLFIHATLRGLLSTFWCPKLRSGVISLNHNVRSSFGRQVSLSSLPRMPLTTQSQILIRYHAH